MTDRVPNTGHRVFRWGLLGTARINRSLIPPLRASEDNRLLAVASRDGARAEAYAREWGIERAHASYQALIEDREIDIVYIPLPNHLHAEWTILAAAAGKHVLCEKPLALNVGEVDAIEAAARKHGVAVAEAFMYRHHPQTLKVKELVEDGAIGELRLVRGSFSFLLENPADFRLRPEWGGGSLWDVGCYPISFTRFLLGQEPVEVFGSQTSGPSGIDVTFAGQLAFPNGVLAQIDSGFGSSFRSGMEVSGTKGALSVLHPWRPRAEQPILLRRGDAVEAIPIPEKDRYLLEIEDLAEAARTGGAPRVTLAESRGNVATIVALLRSAREHRPVRPGA